MSPLSPECILQLLEHSFAGETFHLFVENMVCSFEFFVFLVVLVLQKICNTVMKDQVRIEGSLKKQQKDVQIITTKHKPANHYLNQLVKKLHLGDQCNSAETPPIYNLGQFSQQGWFLQYNVTDISIFHMYVDNNIAAMH